MDAGYLNKGWGLSLPDTTTTLAEIAKIIGTETPVKVQRIIVFSFIAFYIWNRTGD